MHRQAIAVITDYNAEQTNSNAKNIKKQTAAGVAAPVYFKRMTNAKKVFIMLSYCIKSFYFIDCYVWWLICLNSLINAAVYTQSYILEEERACIQ